MYLLNPYNSHTHTIYIYKPKTSNYNFTQSLQTSQTNKVVFILNVPVKALFKVAHSVFSLIILNTESYNLHKNG